MLKKSKSASSRNEKTSKSYVFMPPPNTMPTSRVSQPGLMPNSWNAQVIPAPDFDWMTDPDPQEKKK